MATRAELDRARRALNRLVRAAHGDLTGWWARLRAGERLALTDAVQNGWLALVGHYGDMSAALGADLFEAHAAELGIRPRMDLKPGVDPDRATARLGWALSTENQWGNVTNLLDELVKQPYRSTYQDSAIASGAGWARVPTGAETCAFCLMLASRGAVYSSEQTAGGGKAYHGACDCAPTLVRDEGDYPDGYNPDALYDQYQAARLKADSGDPKKILAALREQQGIH